MENKEQSHHPSKNALRLGSCALVTLILATEKVEDFLALKRAMQDAYDTPTEWEADMLHHAIETEWFHIRATKAYAQLEAKLYQITPNPPIGQKINIETWLVSYATKPNTPTT